MRRLELISGHIDAALSKSSSSPYSSSLLVLSESVRDALSRGEPVVALESTIITHGMSYPANMETALRVERLVVSQGAVPATVAILAGQICVGLTHDQIRHLAQQGTRVTKCSRRDIASCVARKVDGATTVSATLLIAKMAGIRVFVTGGIGGVHRGAEETFDVSADLSELGRTGGVAVVCSGVKSILDIPKTLEVLETHGVSVITYGQTDFPAFFTRSSGLKSHLSSDNLENVAALVRANMDLQLESGVLVAVPVPKEMEAPQEVEDATRRALEELKAKGIAGKDVTPFLLERIAQLSDSKSLQSNIALIEHNATVGAQLAVLLAQRKHGQNHLKVGLPPQPRRFLVVGGAALDVTFHAALERFVEGESNIAKEVVQSPGGVGRNIAEALARIVGGSHVGFASIVGQDAPGKRVVEELESLSVDVALVQRSVQLSTAQYCAFVSPKGALIGAMAAMDVMREFELSETQVSTLSPEVLVLDCNFDSLSKIVDCFRSSQPKVWIDTTSAAKCTRAVDLIRAGRVYGIAPNEAEMEVLRRALGSGKSLFDFGVQIVLLKLGPRGVKVMTAQGLELHVPAPHYQSIVSVTGAGDVLLASIIAQHHGCGLSDWHQIMELANRNVGRTLGSILAVPHDLERVSI